MSITVRKLSELSDSDLLRYLDRRPQSDRLITETCREVIDNVRVRGDDAVLEYTSAFDGVTLDSKELRVSPGEFDDAENSVSSSVAEAVEHSIRNIKRFHQAQRCPENCWMEVEPGVWCGERWTPIDTVCLYVPHGRGAFASVACMLGIAAKIAGVRRIAMCTPPGRAGEMDSATLYACRRMGIDEVYRVGGAQAVAAVAYGTRSIPKCDKLVGPGNVYVSAARRLLSDVIDPGSPAGPSESLIICDDTPDPSNVAWNLLIEAEHGENSTALLVTHSRRMADAVVAALLVQLEQLPPLRRDYAAIVLKERGGVLLTADLNDSVDFANRFAAEHVALMVEDPWTVHPQLTNVGEIVFGDYPIISLANYGMGMNAILPTGGSARSFSPISVRDFVKMTSLGFCTRPGYERLVPVVSALSRDEGFSAHHLAVERWRKGEPNEGTNT